MHVIICTQTMTGTTIFVGKVSDSAEQTNTELWVQSDIDANILYYTDWEHAVCIPSTSFKKKQINHRHKLIVNGAQAKCEFKTPTKMIEGTHWLHLVHVCSDQQIIYGRSHGFPLISCSYWITTLNNTNITNKMLLISMRLAAVTYKIHKLAQH